MKDGVALAIGFATVLAGALWVTSGVRNRGLSEILHGVTSADPETAQAAGSPGTAAAVSPSGGSSTAAKIVAFFVGKGLTPAQAAGIAGNAQQESSDNPSAAGGGLFQDIGSRAPSGTGSLEQQLEHAWAELSGPERGTLAAIQTASTAPEAAKIFSERFERPGEPDLANRESYAEGALASYTGETLKSSAKLASLKKGATEKQILTLNHKFAAQGFHLTASALKRLLDGTLSIGAAERELRASSSHKTLTGHHLNTLGTGLP